MSISVANTSSGLSGKTLVTSEDTATITGLHTFDRDPNAPFAVASGSAVVTNLDADKLDGKEASELATLAEDETVSGAWVFEKSAAGAGHAVVISNSSNSAGSDAYLRVKAAGAGGGDPYLDLTVNGVTSWTVGIDNSDSDKFKVGTAAPGLADKVTIDSSGNTLLAGTISERDRTSPMGAWTDIAHAGGNFTGSGTITWTVAAGDQTTLAYTRIGTSLIIAFEIVNTTVSGTGSELRIALPLSLTAAKAVLTACYIIDNGTRTTGWCGVGSGSSYISINRTDNANFAASTDATSVYGTIIIPASA